MNVLCIGAGRGIGEGIALAFAEGGANVAVSARSIRRVNRVSTEIRKMGRHGLAYSGDATKSADVGRLIRDVLHEFGHLDVLVNCVGEAITKPVVTLPGGGQQGMTEEEWHEIVNLNLTGAFQGCRAFGSHFLARRQGCVINISGWAAFRGAANRAAYDSAKAGLVWFTECLAQEWAPFGVRVNSIAPGLFPDPGQMSPQDYQARQEGAKRAVPMGRLGQVKEVGFLAVFLASPAASYVTGQTWAIDGGLSIKSL